MFSAAAIATVFGPIFVIMGVWTLFYKESVKMVTDSFRKTPAILYLGGVINLIIGLTIITNFNEWSMKSEILVTLVGWMLFLRGVLVFFLPSVVHKLSKLQETTFIFFGLLSVAWGFGLCWLAFM
ncbi:MAG: hypothetical protein K1060chlam2_00036 [Chlamydiae bacterium]|nr:hypothetical protein [Chlamydiota bacterium]